MLKADTSHKIMRSNIVLDVMHEMHNIGMRDLPGEGSKKLIGEIVLTRYNNNAYRFDDIGCEKNPDDKLTPPKCYSLTIVRSTITSTCEMASSL